MRPLRNSLAEASLFRRRAMVAGFFVILASGVLIARYFELQVQRHAEFKTRAEANRIKLRPLPPARGLIYDRNGVLLAENLPAYQLVLIPEQVADVEATLRELQLLIAVSEEDLARFRGEFKAARRFRPVTLKLRLDEEEMARFAVNSHRLPGVEIAPYFTRHYPLGPAFAHVVGYVGRIAESDLARIDEVAYAATTHIGKSGIERQYEKLLHGATGVEQIEANAQGRDLRVIARTPARPGQNLYLSIDSQLQRSMANAFAGQPGAAVALDPRSGEVLAMVSLPTFDPNLFVNGISHADYRALTGDKSEPMFDRVLDGTYAPGSTVKPFMGLAGLELGLRTPEATTLSTGAFRLAGQAREYRDWRAGGHGAVNLRESLAQSVNTYYYKLA
ncbi:MAG: penicillin-binding protein 2, partial [Lysobacterales bacterium]